MRDIAFLVISLGIILIGAELFTNGVEWLGKRLKLGAGAVGSILAAVGTALPETMIPIIAFLGGAKGEHTADVGIGAILGAPFMLSTLAFFIAGLAVVIFRHYGRPLLLNPKIIERDLRFFLLVYSLAVLASFLPFHSAKLGVSIFLIGAYIYYVFQTIRSSVGEEDDGELPPLYIARRTHHPSLAQILLQILLALSAIVVGAHTFVGAVQSVASEYGVAVFVLSLIITPIATELPEKFNSVLWLRRGKDTLAMGNITGAMVFQSSVIPAIGMLLTPWTLEPLALWSAILAIGSALVPYLIIKKRGVIFPLHLLSGGLFYILFILTVVRQH